MEFPEYNSLTLEELQTEFVRLAPIYTDAANRRTYIDKLIQGRTTAAKARIRLSSLSPHEREALAQEIRK